MGAAHSADKEPNAFHHIAVAKEADVEPAVDYGSTWSNLESAAKRASVGDGDHEHSPAPHALHAVSRDFNSAVSEELAQGRVDVNRVSLEKADAIARLEDRGIKSKSAAVQEVVAVSNAHINSRRLSAHDETGDLIRGVLAHAEGLREIIPR